MEMTITLPLDSDGFLRRECPACEQQFKWLPSDEEAHPAPDRYFCPYCRRPAALDAWWTPDQLAYASDLAASEFVGPALEEMADEFNRAMPQRGLVQLSMEASSPGCPTPISEPDDMVRVEFECHSTEPLKIDVDLTREPGCLVCGSTTHAKIAERNTHGR